MSFPAGLSELGLSPDLLGRFQKFLDLLKEANNRVSLISFSTDQELYSNHLTDSLMALADEKARGLTNAKVIDVGTGGGFPGVPLAVARPGWEVTLLDSIQKKERAVAGVVRHLGLANARTLNGRAEELAHTPEHRERYDIALCRAVGELSTVLELTLPFLRVGGFCLLHRGVEARGELDAAAKAMASLGGAPGGLTPYTLPGLSKDRFVVRIEKTHSSDVKYPRRPGMPAKRPL